MLPLNDITVIALEHAVAAPFCTRQLADLGARVIKIERPKVGDFARKYDERVDGMSSHFVWANRSKESLTLDIKTQSAQNILRQLVLKADVLVQNLAPGSASRLGLSFEELSTLNPKIIVCDISGYGDDIEHPGPYHEKKAYDLLIQSESGFLSVSGTKNDYAKAGCSISDIAAGMYAYSNILAALIEREKTGKGKRIDISMLESMTEWMSYPLYYAYRGNTAPLRTGASHATIYPYGPFPTGDNKQVILGVQNEQEWKAFCTIVLQEVSLLDVPEFINNSLRSKNRDKLQDIILNVFKHLKQTEIIHRLELANIANAQINEMKDVWHHSQLQARQRWTVTDTPIGRVPTLKPVGRKHDEDYQIKPVPSLSEHTHTILRELGYSEISIQELIDKAII